MTELTHYDKTAIEQKVREMKDTTEETTNEMRGSPDGSVLIFATFNGEQGYTVNLWKLGEEHPEKANIDTGWGTGFGWSPNSKYVLIEGGTSWRTGPKKLFSNQQQTNTIHRVLGR